MSRLFAEINNFTTETQKNNNNHDIMKRIIILPLLIIGTLFMSICCSGPSSRIAPEKNTEFITLLKNADFKAAESMLLALEEQYEGDPQLFMFRSYYYFFSSAGSDNRLDSALMVISSGIEQYPDRLDMRSAKADMLLAMNEPYKVSQELISALEYSVVNDNNWTFNFKITPVEDNMLYLRAIIQDFIPELMKFNDLRPVEDLIAASLRLYPKDPMYMSNLGKLKEKKGDYAGALEAQLAALELDPDNTLLMLYVSDAYLSLGDVVNATKYCAIVAQSDHETNSAIAKTALQMLMGSSESQE